MSLTLTDVKDRLKQQPETIVLEVLDINSEELVDRFEDKVEERMDYLMDDLDGGTYNEEW